MPTTISPALGHAIMTQGGPGAAPGYDAQDFRRLATASLQEGVMGASSFEVVQRSAGATLSVDVKANVADAASGVAALVQGDAVAGQSLYPVAPHSSVINEAIASNSSGNPRIDQVVLEVLDDVHDASGSNIARVRVIAGTASSGATLNNRTGAASLPGSCIRLADVLVANGASSITNSQIRDRRTWACGAYCRIIRNANGAGSSDANASYALTSATIAYLDSVNLAPRIECSGAPVRVRLIGTVAATAITTRTALVSFSPQMDGSGVSGMASIGSNPASNDSSQRITIVSDGLALPCFEWTFTPASGSHVIAPAYAKHDVSGATNAEIFANAARPLVWEIEEIVRQNTANNVTTSG
ncbi:MAG TPA: hypothetical protein VNS09_16100 [Solirubrobacter sp.]|nr:hypothetical protein [Solirubrobacter sp.]